MSGSTIPSLSARVFQGLGDERMHERMIRQGSVRRFSCTWDDRRPWSRRQREQICDMPTTRGAIAWLAQATLPWPSVWPPAMATFGVCSEELFGAPLIDRLEWKSRWSPRLRRDGRSDLFQLRRPRLKEWVPRRHWALRPPPRRAVPRGTRWRAVLLPAHRRLRLPFT